jgi:hypothetical protein
MRIHEITEDIGETRRLLFHTTTAARLAMILGTDLLDAKTTDLARGSNGRNGISLTRSYDFASKFKGSRGIILVIDASRIATKPVAYWTHDEQHQYNRADEMEEVATKPIAPLSRYLVSINAPISFDQWVDRVQDMRDDEEYVPHMLGAGLDRFKAQIDHGFADWRLFWNVWQPVRGSAKV